MRWAYKYKRLSYILTSRQQTIMPNITYYSGTTKIWNNMLFGYDRCKNLIAYCIVLVLKESVRV